MLRSMAFNAVAVAIGVAFVLSFPGQNRTRAVALLFPLLLVLNIALIQHKVLRKGQTNGGGVMDRRTRISTYVFSSIFFLGTAYGLLLLLGGEIPWTISPVLLIPLLLAIYALRIARKKA